MVLSNLVELWCAIELHRETLKWATPNLPFEQIVKMHTHIVRAWGTYRRCYWWSYCWCRFLIQLLEEFVKGVGFHEHFSHWFDIHNILWFNRFKRLEISDVNSMLVDISHSYFWKFVSIEFYRKFSISSDFARNEPQFVLYYIDLFLKVKCFWL